MFQLESENLGGLGAPMGTDKTQINWCKYFKTMAEAKSYAEKDFGSKIKWHGNQHACSSPDLRYVMYHIDRAKIEE